jgi:spore coat protein U-like protein
MKHYLLAVFLVIGAPAAAEAQLSCSLNVTPVQFDSISGTSAGTFDARGMITVSCTGSQGANIAACLELGQGAASATSGQRLLTPVKGTGALPVQVFQDASLTRPWGTAAINQALMIQRTGDGPMSATAYFRAYVQKGNVPAGTYSAQFPIALRYGAVTGGFADCNALRTVGAGPASPSPKTFAAVPGVPRRR